MQAIVQDQDIDIEIKLKNNRKYTWRKNPQPNFYTTFQGIAKNFIENSGNLTNISIQKGGMVKFSIGNSIKKILETAKS